MPNKAGQIYVCEICGNKVEMLVAGKGQLYLLRPTYEACGGEKIGLRI